MNTLPALFLLLFVISFATSYKKCGHSKYQKARIVGGTFVYPGEYPWLAMLYKYDNPKERNFSHFCTGSVITNRHILTAAHCMWIRNLKQWEKPENFKVRLGEYDYKNKYLLPEEIVQDFDVEELSCHKNFDRHNFWNDICILRLAKKINFTPYIQPICLPWMFENEEFTYQMVTVAGWGDLNEESERAHVLTQVQIRVYPMEECVNIFANFDYNINGDLMCAGQPEDFKDSCYRDSGGSLFLPIRRQYYAVGIVSFGIKCAKPGVPGVYTRVTTFLDWIREQLLLLQ